MLSVERIAAIEAEFDEPALDVIIGFADLGYARTTTARALGLSLSAFRRLLAEIDPAGAIGWPANGMSREHRDAQRRRRGSQRTLMACARAQAARMRRVQIAGRAYTYPEIAAIAGITRSAVAKRVAAGWRGSELLAPAVDRAERGRRCMKARWGGGRKTHAAHPR